MRSQDAATLVPPLGEVQVPSPFPPRCGKPHESGCCSVSCLLPQMALGTGRSVPPESAPTSTWDCRFIMRGVKQSAGCEDSNILMSKPAGGRWHPPRGSCRVVHCLDAYDGRHCGHRRRDTAPKNARAVKRTRRRRRRDTRLGRASVSLVIGWCRPFERRINPTHPNQPFNNEASSTARQDTRRHQANTET